MKTPCPVPFNLPDYLLEWAEKNVPRLDLAWYTAQFEDYWTAHGKKMVNWDATWRNWMRKASDESRPHLKQATQRPYHPKVSDIFKSGDTMSRAEALKRFK